MSAPNLITRQDVADLLNVSTDIVRKNEKQLGLDKARQDINRRCVRYVRARVHEILANRGFLSATATNFHK